MSTVHATVPTRTAIEVKRQEARRLFFHFKDHSRVIAEREGCDTCAFREAYAKQLRAYWLYQYFATGEWRSPSNVFVYASRTAWL